MPQHNEPELITNLRQFAGESLPLESRIIEAQDAQDVIDFIGRLYLERESLLSLVNDLADADECVHDHHGYCQTHGWMTTQSECPHARAAEILMHETEEA